MAARFPDTASGRRCTGVRLGQRTRHTTHEHFRTEREYRRLPRPGQVATPGTSRARGKTAGGRAQRWARGRHRRAGRGARASRPDRPAQAGGQARPSRARCARRVQDRPARRHSVPGRAEQPKSVAGGLKGPGTLASMACSARSSSASRSRSPRWRRASACSGEVETGFPNRICAKSTNPGLTRKGRETRFAGGVERGRADRLRAISSHCTETQVCHNSHIVRERAGRYKLAPRARGFA